MVPLSSMDDDLELLDLIDNDHSTRTHHTPLPAFARLLTYRNNISLGFPFPYVFFISQPNFDTILYLVGDIVKSIVRTGKYKFLAHSLLACSVRVQGSTCPWPVARI